MSTNYMPAIKGNRNYSAQVVRMPAPRTHPNADRLEIFDLFGYQVISSIGTHREGDLAMFFPAEAQLSASLCWYANLFRHSELNLDKEQKGYLEDNRRVRALKLRGVVSSALVLPLEEVLNAFNAIKHSDEFPVGLSFDHIGETEVSRKYVVKQTVEQVSPEDRKYKKAFKRVDAELFPQHVDTDQFFRVVDGLNLDDELIVTQKLHGTSGRFGRVPVRRELKWYERLAAKLGVQVKDYELDVLAGSRKVIKDPKSTTQNHFYKHDVWNDMLEGIERLIPEGYILYGEIVGFTPDGDPIQKGHTYDEYPGEMSLYVYRVATVNYSGDVVDLSWDQVRGFCQQRDLNTVPELWRGPLAEFEWRQFEEKNFYREFAEGTDSVGASHRDIPVPLSEGGTGVDEGIAIRVERGAMTPYLMKVKNASHFAFETAQLDAGEVDLESAEAVAA